MAQFMNKVKMAVGLQQEENKSFLHQVDEAVTLTWKQRMIGFGCCFGFGLLLWIIAMPMLWMMQLTKFAVLYSFGSIVSMLSTLFLMGPVKQIQRMFDQGRIIATCVYIGAIVATLVVAFKLHNVGLVIICLVIQVLAFVWYVITWIPGGQAMLSAMIFRK